MRYPPNANGANEPTTGNSLHSGVGCKSNGSMRAFAPSRYLGFLGA
jgi:hypothetical protein